MRKAADLAKLLGCGGKVEIGKRMGVTAAGRRANVLQQMPADEMRRAARRAGDADIHVRLAKIDRQQLRVTVGEMQQAHVAERRCFVGVATRSAAQATRKKTSGTGATEQPQKITPVHNYPAASDSGKFAGAD